jgi:YfiH family protein
VNGEPTSDFSNSVWNIANVRVTFTDRYDGISPHPDEMERLGADAERVVRENRAKAARSLGLSPSQVVYMRQVHQADVRHIVEPFGGDPPPLDGLCTTESSLALAVLVADCAPVFLADPIAGVVGAAHAGRKGITAGIILRLLDVMGAHGAQQSRMSGFIGPTVCELCYEVPGKMRDEVADVLPAASAVSRWGSPSIDLRSAAASQLRSAGISDIQHDRRCTAETKNLFSRRREGPTGDFAGYIWFESETREDQ